MKSHALADRLWAILSAGGLPAAPCPESVGDCVACGFHVHRGDADRASLARGVPMHFDCDPGDDGPTPRRLGPDDRREVRSGADLE